jgi:hypothetical protein
MIIPTTQYLVGVNAAHQPVCMDMPGRASQRQLTHELLSETWALVVLPAHCNMCQGPAAGDELTA